MTTAQEAVRTFIQELRSRTNPDETDYHRAVEDVLHSVMPLVLEDRRMQSEAILERLVEPDRSVIFRVPWEADDGTIHVERGFRVQFNHCLGPYKGGLRFDPSVNLGTFKFLGFEQTLKNALTMLPLGAGKGGATFSPKGRSRREVMRFCQSFMVELCRHIGEDTDVPAGDQGVGSREVGFLFGQYTRIRNRWAGVLTGKKERFGGSHLRPEATGYGCVYFLQHMLDRQGLELSNKSVSISGAGNVALKAAEKVVEEGGKLLTLSDSSGFIVCKEGMSASQLEEVSQLKLEERGSLSALAEKRGFEFHDSGSVWSVDTQIALPCATQNEVSAEDAKQLVRHNVIAIAEGANLPLSQEAARIVQQSDILYAPGKAANAGGVAVSAFEMSQNAERHPWEESKVDSRLREVMRNIHNSCVEHGRTRQGAGVDYVCGANRAGFLRVANAMLAQGVS